MNYASKSIQNPKDLAVRSKNTSVVLPTKIGFFSTILPEPKSSPLKKAIHFFIYFCCLQGAIAQPSLTDTSGLKEQKEKIITASTIIKIENLGADINTKYSELRPTISADGNLLFFIVENHPKNTNYRIIRNSQKVSDQRSSTSITCAKNGSTRAG